MDEKLELGGNITLTGFSNLEKSKLVVLKKIVGNYAKTIGEKKKFEKLILTMANKENKHKIKAEVIFEGNTITSEKKEDNIFIALDSALKEIINKL